MKLRPDSLAFALSNAARALASVEAGTALPRALSELFDGANLPPAARGAIQDLCYRSLRQWGIAQALVSKLSDNPPTPPKLKALLACALALLSEDEPGYADHTLVDQAVTACAADPELARAKGMVNAVLRRMLRERATLLAQLRQHADLRWNYPAWWIAGLQSAYPSEWERVLAAGNAQPPLTLRVNLRKATVADMLDRFTHAGIAAHQVGPVALRLARPRPVHEIPGFADGYVSVQDAAAQLAAPLLDLQDGMRVLDACAAPGGKTGHLLEIAQLDLLALDHDALRLQRVAQNLNRLQLQAELRQGDAAAKDWWNGQLFDRILADVPCTASGIVRRHPDIRWLRRPEDAAQLARLSAAILDNLWTMLKPGGRLLLVTCSLWPEESEMQARRFIERSGARRLEAPGQLLPLAAADADHDGLFYALLEKPRV
jgi:16S rRNA (cytosine967-C5)-methyltransferase